MENREQQILSEIRQMISSMRLQLELLEEKVAELETDAGPEVVEDIPIDLDIEDWVEREVIENEDTDETEAEDVPAEEAEDVPAEEPVEVLEEDEDLPEAEVLVDSAVAAAKPAVIDAMATKEAWRTDIPGSPVKDIRSAISLNDRILFINSLFGEDPMLFQTVLTKINSMTSLDEAVEYVRSERPSWDMDSDEVYRFMMAVRRRIQ